MKGGFFKNLLFACAALIAVISASAMAQQGDPQKPFEPYQGQPGKDVIWVPTPQATVTRMLDLAGATPQDYVIDLGSGDGRIVIAAAKRGIAGHGVEFNADMVALSNRLAAEAGVADKARFIQGDMFEADLSKATVLPLFLLSENLEKLSPKFLALKPGTRIVLNGYQIYGWSPDETAYATGDCGHWCTVYLYVVPAKIDGAWRLGDMDLTISQEYQKISGMLGGSKIEHGLVRGDEIRFTVGKTAYVGRISGNELQGEMSGDRRGPWRARKQGA